MDVEIRTLAGPVAPLLMQDGAPASLPTIGFQLQDPRVQVQAVAGVPVISGGVITSIPMRVLGQGYTAAPAVTISGGGGSSAAGTAVLNTQGNPSGVQSITVTNGGTGYTSQPFIDIAAPSAITGIANAVSIATGNASKSNFGKFTFFARGSSGNTINFKIVAWNKVLSGSSAGQWQATTLAYLLGTLGTATGASVGLNQDLTAPFTSHNIIGTLAASILCPSGQIWPPDNGQAVLMMDLSGAEAISLIPGANGSGSATGINGLFQGL